MNENKRFPSILNRVIFIDTGHELIREEIIEQIMTQRSIISDEEAFERHLIRKYTDFV